MPRSPGFADFAIRQAAGIDSEPAVAYNSQTHEYLVVWVQASTSGMGPLMGQRVSESGSLSGSPITISAIAWGRASVAYNAAQNQFLVAFTTGILPDYGINGRLLDAAGSLVGSSDSAHESRGIIRKSSTIQSQVTISCWA